jgi:hypothetical protein
MSGPIAVGLGLALASALALDAGFLLQQSAAALAPRLSARRPLASARALVASRRWTGGFVLGIGGWGLYFCALALAPLSLVQTVAAAGIGLLVVLLAIARRALPARRELIGALLATLGLMALAGSIGGARVSPESAPAAAALAGLALAGLVVVAAALRRRSAALGGLAAGACYGIGDVISKVLLIELPHHPSLGALAASPLLYATAAAHGLGFLLLQRAFQSGGPLASLGAMTAAMNLLPMSAGVLLLGERLPAGSLAIGLRLCAFGAAVAGAWALSVRSTPEAPHAPPVESGVWLNPSLPTAAR